ncbi:disease resistance protein TAO1-like [Eucalyptus grandis]|uniref:disease resistance protein TAO1-like n=1 Tax=Eucalyptus grandis TaxID=71139 RepID=UPI00192E8E2F|nr:disease resistance protein TAO1-like [Eucalyptus grandis]
MDPHSLLKSRDTLQYYIFYQGIENAVGLTPRRKGDNFTRKYFADLTNARFLKLDGGNFAGNFEDILPKLRWLCWQNCPAELQAKKFVLNHLVILKLSGDISIDKWRGWVDIMVASKLKVLKIARSKSLIETPCFSEFMSLERLVLEDLSNLVQIDHSIGNLERLIYLKIKWCPLLRGLPWQIGYLNALRQVILIQGFSICYLPDSIGNLRLLSRLVVEDTGIVELPSTIKGLVDLEYLSLANCTSLNLLPDAIGELKSLTELDLSGTTIEELPHSIYNFRDLTLRLNSSKIRTQLMGDCLSLEGIEDCFNCIRLQADWKSAPKNLMGVSLEKIQQKLMLIHEGLKDGEKFFFLHIARSFLIKKKTEAVYIQEGCADFPKVEIDALVNKSLIKITDQGRIWMHDLVRDFAGEFITEEIIKIYDIWLFSRINGKGKSKQSGYEEEILSYFSATPWFLDIIDAKAIWLLRISHLYSRPSHYLTVGTWPSKKTWSWSRSCL